MSGSNRRVWDAAADRFDDEPDHGLRDQWVRTAWSTLLTSVLPPPPARVLDVGAGTGSLSLLLAEQGYRVTGIDVSPRMVAAARDKADRHAVDAVFVVGDAACPPVDGQFDVVLCRHVLWALADPEAALNAWLGRLRPGGRILLIEGLWGTGAGLPGSTVLAMVTARVEDVELRSLSERVALWGGPVADDRYLVTGTAPGGSSP